MRSATTDDPERPRLVRRVLIVTGLVALVAFGLALLGFAWTAVLTLFGGALIGVLLDGIAVRIAKWTHMPRWVALGLILLLAVGATIGFGFWLGPAVVDHVEGLREQLNLARGQVQSWLGQRSWGPRVLEDLSEIQLTSIFTPRFGGLLSTTAGTAVSLVLIGVFGVYFAMTPERYVDGFVGLIPREHRDRVRELLASIARALRSWLVGRCLSMAVIGTGTAVGLWIAGVPLALPLGIVAGSRRSCRTSGRSCPRSRGSWSACRSARQTAMWALLVYVIVQVLESYAITPFIEQHVVSMPPVLLLAFQMLMGLSAGVIGLFMATPLLVIIVVTVQLLYVRDILGDEVEVIGNAARSPRPDHQAS